MVLNLSLFLPLSLFQDILVSQSDYVKSELMILHQQLKPLEERAGLIEKEIREAMAKGQTKNDTFIHPCIHNHLSIHPSIYPSLHPFIHPSICLSIHPYHQCLHSSLHIITGDSNKEELLTVEYFKLLNEKNVLIKKQIELNLL